MKTPPPLPVHRRIKITDKRTVQPAGYSILAGWRWLYLCHRFERLNIKPCTSPMHAMNLPLLAIARTRKQRRQQKAKS